MYDNKIEWFHQSVENQFMVLRQGSTPTVKDGKLGVSYRQDELSLVWCAWFGSLCISKSTDGKSHNLAYLVVRIE